MLACLIEKKLSTPGNYPLTLNSLVLACNQSSNRDPVVEYDQHVVNDALVATREQGLSSRHSKSGSRTAKFDEHLSEKLGLNEKQSAVLAELLLRGPQTPGELRQRTTRMRDFPDLAELEEVLEGMAGGSDPIVVRLPVQPGRREARYAHTLCGAIDLSALEAAQSEPSEASSNGNLTQRVTLLERLVQELSERLEMLEARPAE